MSLSAAPETRSRASHMQPVPPDPELLAEQLRMEPSCSRNGKNILVANGGTLPVGFCIKSGRPAQKVVMTSLRDPMNPKTWFGKQPRIEVGLSQKHHDSFLVAGALTWSFLGIGILILASGILSMSWASCIIGFLAIAISGVFRASSTVTSKNATEDFAEIKGASESFLKHLPVSEPSL